MSSGLRVKIAGPYSVLNKPKVVLTEAKDGGVVTRGASSTSLKGSGGSEAADCLEPSVPEVIELELEKQLVKLPPWPAPGLGKFTGITATCIRH
jgi:hypothetical protein